MQWGGSVYPETRFKKLFSVCFPAEPCWPATASKLSAADGGIGYFFIAGGCSRVRPIDSSTSGGEKTQEFVAPAVYPRGHPQVDQGSGLQLGSSQPVSMVWEAGAVLGTRAAMEGSLSLLTFGGLRYSHQRKNRAGTFTGFRHSQLI